MASVVSRNYFRYLSSAGYRRAPTMSLPSLRKISSTSSCNVWSSKIYKERERRERTSVWNTAGRNLQLTPLTNALSSRRHLWGWLNAIFNKVDESRIKEVGPDRACAEWLLRCGALVKWKDRDLWTKNYNSLPQTGGRLLKIEEVDATDAAIMHIGFPHFKNCKHIRKIVFHKAIYLEDAGMALLPLLKDSLKELRVSSCGNVTVDGLRHIKQLVNLEYLLLYDLPEIRDKEAITEELQEALPNCAVVFPYAQPEDDPSIKKNESKE